MQELHNDYSLAPDKLDIRREILSECQLKIDDSCNIPTFNFKTFCLSKKLFWWRKVCARLWKRTTLLESRIKTKKTHHVLEFDQL